MTDHGKTEQAELLTPLEKFENMARRLFNAPKHELDEEIAKEQAETKDEKPSRKPKSNYRKEAA